MWVGVVEGGGESGWIVRQLGGGEEEKVDGRRKRGTGKWEEKGDNQWTKIFMNEKK